MSVQCDNISQSQRPTFHTRGKNMAGARPSRDPYRPPRPASQRRTASCLVLNSTDAVDTLGACLASVTQCGVGERWPVIVGRHTVPEWCSFHCQKDPQLMTPVSCCWTLGGSSLGLLGECW